MFNKGQPDFLQVLGALAEPPNYGAAIRSWNLCLQLFPIMTITRVGFGSMPSTNGQTIVVPKPRKYTLGKITQGLIGPYPVSVLNYTASEMFVTLQQLTESVNFSIIQMESVHFLPYLFMLRRVTPISIIVCDWHLIDSELMARFADRCVNPAKRMYARRTAKLLADAERTLARLCDLHFSVSRREQKFIQSLAPEVPVFLIPNGVHCAEHASQPLQPYSEPSSASTQPLRVVFVGALDYHANVEGLVWFCHKVWPILIARLPNLALTIVGRNPGPEIRRLGLIGNVELIGEVNDVRPYYAGAIAAIAPLRVCSGVRIKLLEAMAASTPVISTSLGAEGLEIVSGTHYLRADNAREWVSTIVELVADRRLGRRIAAEARRHVEKCYDWEVIGQQLRRIYADAINTLKRK